MGNTPNWNVYFLSAGDPSSQMTESAAQAGSIETALNLMDTNLGSIDHFGIKHFANASDRDLALTSPQVGWLSQLDSELFIRRWDGSAWKPFGAEAYPLKPTSVGGNTVTVDSTGLVSWSGTGGVPTNPSSWVTVNGVFASEFRRFRVDVNGTLSAQGTTIFRLVSGGVLYDNASGYANLYVTSGGTSTATGSSTTSYGFISATSVRTLSGSMEFSAMSGTSSTDKIIRTQVGGELSGGLGSSMNVTHCITTSPVDGFALRAAADATNLSGSLRVYGIL